jgi:two-component system chemotaxis response regulator CheY
MQVNSMNGGVDEATMLLPKVLDLAAAEGLLATMCPRVESEGPICFDASAVEILTLPCAQILLAAKRSNDRLAIENPSLAFMLAFEDLGINWSWDVDLSQQQPEAAIEQVPQQAADEGGGQDQSGREDLQQTSESPMGKRILTIDDSKTMRDMLMLTLAEAGFDVLQAVDGQDGLDVLGDQPVDVVITDINMPRMDGYEVIRQLRRNPNHKTTPILVLTTESEAEKKNLAREAGATGWMVKPFDPDRLVATVRKVAP